MVMKFIVMVCMLFWSVVVLCHAALVRPETVVALPDVPLSLSRWLVVWLGGAPALLLRTGTL